MLRVTAVVVVTSVILTGFAAWVLTTSGSSPQVFDGVTDVQLAEAGIIVVDPQPTGAPGISEYEARRIILQQAGVVVQSAKLVTVQIKSPPAPSSSLGKHFAWAIRVDTSELPEPEPYFGPGAFWIAQRSETAIVFLSAYSGGYLAQYERFAASVTPTPGPATPLPTNPP